MASERGIGVAVIWSRLTAILSFLSTKAWRWPTPKRCCSSIMTKPSCLNWTVSWIKAWVPMTTWICPLAKPSKTACLALAVMALVKSAASIPMEAKSWLKDWACCLARISVGAIRADWKPPLKLAKIARKATRVFPLPTSPCTMRRIGCWAIRSRQISLTTCFCAWVNSYGKRLIHVLSWSLS